VAPEQSPPPSGAGGAPPSEDPGEQERIRLSGGRLLGRNVLLNIVGRGATLIAAFVAVPLLIDGLGTARFGILALAWVVIGSASVFDLGLGLALTRLTSEKLGGGREADTPGLFWTALAGLLGFGTLVALLVAGTAPLLVDHVLNVPESLRDETLTAFFLLAAGLPFLMTGAGLRGYLEARQRADAVNAVVIPVAAITYFGPVITLQFSDSLVPAVGAIAASRAIAFVLYMTITLRLFPLLRHRMALDRSVFSPLLRTGGWYTLWNTLNTLLLTMDRFLVGALLSVTAVAYYATPLEISTKLWIFVWALVGVLFPAFSINLARNPQRAATLFSAGVRITFVVLFPITLLFVAFAYQGLDLWVGEDFAQQSFRVLQWIVVGVLASSLSQVANTLVLSARPDFSAKLALIQVPFYIGLFVALTEGYGIEGAAVAWTARIVVEAVVLFAFVGRLLPDSRRLISRAVPTAAAAAAVLALASQPDPVAVKALIVVVAGGAFALVAWLRILSAEERGLVRRRLWHPSRA